MLTIQKAQEKNGKTGKYIVFSLIGNFEGFLGELRGWRYFVGSGDIKPPVILGRIPTQVFTAEFHLEVKRAIEAYLERKNSPEDLTWCREVWDAYRRVIKDGEVDEFLGIYTGIEQGLQAAVVRMLLEVHANPERHLEREIEGVVGGGGEN